MLLIFVGLVIYIRFSIATEPEITEIYGKIFWSLGYLAMGFFFYVTHTPERFLTSWFGNTKSSRNVRETI